MPSSRLTGSAQAVSLGEGYALRAPGLRGEATLLPPADATTRSRATAPDPGMAALDEALRAQHVDEVKRIDLSVQPAPGAAADVTLRSGGGRANVELQVPDLGDEVGQLVLSIDDAGAVRWHLPEPDVGGTAASRGAGGSKRFLIPATVVSGSTGESSATSRSIFGAAARRLLKVLVYPITDPIIGKLSELFASHWESTHRPYGLRSLTPDNYQNPDVPQLDTAAITAMAAQGPILLFVHGTFSTAHAAFGGLPRETMQQLHARYGQRVVAFNHPSLSAAPEDNVRWLLDHLPATPMAVDVICHSRGGLVARVLAERLTAFALDASHVQVGRVAFVGVPNQGTALADADHMVSMIDRLTTALTLFPTGPVTETLEAMLTVLKMISHGFLKGLPGIAGMQPGGAFLSKLNTSSTTATQYFGMTSNYEPTDSGLRGLVSGAADGAIDQVFENAQNDLVVPTDGVWDSNGATGFPLQTAHLLVLKPADGVMHTSYFPHQAVSQRLLQWMTV